MTQIDIAKQYLGKLEKTGNSGFVDPVFEDDMKAVGWISGYSWCILFDKMVFIKAFPDHKAELMKVLNPSTIKSFELLKAAAYSIKSVPSIGNLVIWQDYAKGKPTDHGHAGIVTELPTTPNTFKSIEGNTSGDKPSRNGDRVAEHIHFNTLITGKRADGLNVLGFITIPK